MSRSWKSPETVMAFLLHAVVLSILVARKYPWIEGDSQRYLDLSRSLASGAGYGLFTDGVFEPEAYRLPGYPVFLSLIRLGVGDSLLAVVAIQAVMFLASVWFAWRVADHVFGEATGRTFLMLSSFYPFVAYSVPQIMTETCVVFLVSLAVYGLSRPSFLWFLLSGMALGMTAYFRANLVILGVAAFLLCVAVGGALRRNSVALLLGTLLSLAPLTAYHYVTFGVASPVQVAKASGTSLFVASWQGRVSLDSLIQYGTRRVITDELRRSGMYDQLVSINREIGVPDTHHISDPGGYPDNRRRILANDVLTRHALENIRQHPASYLGNTFVNAFRLWFSVAFVQNSVPGFLGVPLLAMGVAVLALGLWGGVSVLLKRDAQDNPLAILMVMLCVVFSASLCWLHTEARYTIPARLLLLTLAAHSVTRYLERRER